LGEKLHDKEILQEILGERGCISMLIVDTVPMGRGDGNTMRGFG
jgi:hypothetical protein